MFIQMKLLLHEHLQTLATQRLNILSTSEEQSLDSPKDSTREVLDEITEFDSEESLHDRSLHKNRK